MKRIMFLVVLVFALFNGVKAEIPKNIPKNGLIGYWPFNGNANDESGNGNHGTLNDANLADDRNGEIEHACFLPSLDGNINVISKLKNYNGKEQTISLWLKIPLQFNPSSLYLITNGHHNKDGFYVGLDQNDAAYGKDNYLIVYTIGNTSTSFITNQNVLSNWTNIVAIYNGSSIKLFLNGIMQSETSYNTSINSNNADLLFADWDNPTPPNNPERFIDDIGIWNRALTEEEIKNVYDEDVNVTPCELPKEGLVGYWPFCGNADDKSGNENHGTVNGATLTEDRFGRPNQAYYFDGKSWIEVLHDKIFDFETKNSISLSLWFRTSQDKGAVFVQKQSGEGQTQNGFNGGLLRDGNGLAGIVHKNGYDLSIVNSKNVNYNDSNWHYFTYTFDKGVAKLYFNGKLIKTQNDLTSIVGNSETNLIFGFGLPNNNFYFSGDLDDIAIWDRALSDQEIQQVYKMECDSCETPPPPPCELPKDGLVGYWPFCGNADDKSGNENHGTVNGATLTEDRFGRPNQAYSFDGVDDYIKGNFNNFPVGNEARSITSWIKINKDTTLFQNFIIAWGTANSVNTGFGVHIYEWLDNIGVWLADGNSKELIGYTFMPNKYYFLGLTIDQNQNALIYVDGKLLLKFNLKGMNTDINNEFYIGKSTHFKVDQWAGYFSGDLDDIAIWDRALSEAEIQQVYKMECDVCDVAPEKEYFKFVEIGDCNESKFYLTVSNSDKYETFDWENGDNQDTILIDKIGSYKVKIRSKNGNVIEIDTLITELVPTFKNSNVTNFQTSDYEITGNTQYLTSGIILTENKSMEKGAIWQTKKLNVNKDFKVSFGFKVYNGFNNFMFEQSYPGADGFAFVFQNHEPNPIGESGGGIGYSGIPNSLAIELDLFGNYLNLDSIYDPNGNHLAIFSNKSKPNSSRHKTDALIIQKDSLIEVLGDSTLYFFNIEYNKADKTLKTAISKTELDFTDPMILSNFEFSDYLKLDNNEYTFVGITSATGTASQVHEITNLNICGQTALINTSVESAENDLLIYPNPVINELNINLQEDTKSIIIYDLLGNIIFEDYNLEINNTSYKVNTIEFPKGTYILEIKTDKNIMTSKFIKM